MKRLFITAVAIAASTASFAQTETAQPAAQPAATEMAQPATTEAAAPDTRKQIKIEELPAAVRADLNTVQYKGWAPSVAYWVSDSKNDWYEITMVSGDESKIVKYNAEGSKLD